MRVAAPAKLNLALAVTGRRADGFHTLRSVFARLALHDDLEVALAADPGAPDSLEVEGHPDTPIEGNLVLRAAAQLREGLERPAPALHFHLRKRIPIAAGMAGGSSDGVAALDLAARAWGVNLRPAERLAAALRLGADGPFFAAGHDAAIVEGVGERVEGLPSIRPPAGFVLVTPAQRLSTAAVFAELDRQGHAVGTTETAVDELARGLRSGVDGAVLASLGSTLRGANDLWEPAQRLAPALARQREALEAALDRPVLLTGSGSTLFAIYPSSEAAARAADDLAARLPEALTGAVILATATSDTGGTP